MIAAGAGFMAAAALMNLAFDYSASRAQAWRSVLLSAAGSPARTILAVGTPFPVLSGKADQTAPAVAYDMQSNRYLVVWQDTGDDGGNIYGRLVEGSGELSSHAFPISTAPGLQANPTVIFSPARGVYLVVWQDLRHGEATGWDIYAQRVSGDGALLDDAEPASNISVVQAAGHQFRPALGYYALLDRFLVVWENDQAIEDEEGNVSYDRHVYGRLISADGSLLGEPFVVSSGSGDHSYPALTYNATRGQFLLVWQRQDVWLSGQRLDGHGQLVGPRLTISTGSFRTYPVPVPKAAHGDVRDEYLVVWDTATTSDVYGRRLDGEGRPLEAAPFAISSAPQKQLRPSLGRHQFVGGYLTLWTDERSRPARGWDVYGQFITDVGTLVAEDGTSVANPAVNIPFSVASGDQISPTLAYNERQNEFLLVWQDGRVYPSLGWEIYAQRYLARALGPTPTSTATPSSTPTATSTATPTSTPSPTATPTPNRIFLPVVPDNVLTRWMIYIPVVFQGLP